jgi:hypothetical protein
VQFLEEHLALVQPSLLLLLPRILPLLGDCLLGAQWAQYREGFVLFGFLLGLFRDIVPLAVVQVLQLLLLSWVFLCTL